MEIIAYLLNFDFQVIYIKATYLQWFEKNKLPNRFVTTSALVMLFAQTDPVIKEVAQLCV